MPRIFLSYRRDDSAGVAGRIYDRLAAKFGPERVFFDVDSIPFGVDFRQHIAGMVSGCDAMLAVIGGGWTGAAHEERRIDDPRDFVRIEVETALRQGVRVIPILVGRTPMPSEAELPEALRTMAFLHACPIDPGRDFIVHVERLMRSLDAPVPEPAEPQPRASTPSPVRPRRNRLRLMLAAGAAFVLVSAIGAGIVAWRDVAAVTAPAPAPRADPWNCPECTQTPADWEPGVVSMTPSESKPRPANGPRVPSPP